MSEWSKEHDWKSCDVKASAGSNPVLCANKYNLRLFRTEFEPRFDPVGRTVSGKFKIIYINTPEEIKTAFSVVDRA